MQEIPEAPTSGTGNGMGVPPLPGGIPVHQGLLRPLLIAGVLRLASARAVGWVRSSIPSLLLSPTVRSLYPPRFSTSRQTLTWIPDSFFSR